MKYIFYMAFFSCVVSATLVAVIYISYKQLYNQNQQIVYRIDYLSDMVKKDLQFALVDDQAEIDKIILETALDFKTTGAECLIK